VVAAVSVSVPNVVLSADQVLELLDPLQAVGERISRDCGYRPPS
jgi:DNA-binding IclR family transcriptional regulator